jgi:hypothetical protein
LLRLLLDRFLAGEDPATELPPARTVTARLLDMLAALSPWEGLVLLLLMLPLGRAWCSVVSVCSLLLICPVLGWRLPLPLLSGDQVASFCFLRCEAEQRAEKCGITRHESPHSLLLRVVAAVAETCHVLT